MRDRRTKPRLPLTCGLLACLLGGIAVAQEPPALPGEAFARRREALLETMAPNSVAVFAAASMKMRSGDVEYPYRQDSDFYYLTGYRQPNAFLILTKDASGATGEIFFLPQSGTRGAAWVGEPPPPDEAERTQGLRQVETIDRFWAALDSLLAGKTTLYHRFETGFVYEPLSGERIFIGRQAKRALRDKYPGLRIRAPGALLAELRQIKSAAEIELMRRAVAITCQAHVEAMKAARPGLYEYQLQAVIEFVFGYNGAEAPAFPSIVGSGPNAIILHYSANRRQMRDGDLVVMDIGAEYRGYAADVTRTIPVSGRFSKPQREIYEIVLAAQRAALAEIRPGVPLRAVHQAARRVIQQAGYGAYFTHGTSHFLGLDTHDVGAAGAELQPGMVITVEPGIYIPAGAELDSTYWNIGVRIEDDVLVTENGYEVLSSAAPKDAAAVEALMREETVLTHRF